MKELINRLAIDFEDKEYAHAYMESHAISRIAAQIHTLRKQRNWSQDELAKNSGIAQERISKLESADFNSLTMKTLNKLSRAFDVNLLISFTKFSDGIDDIVKIHPENLEVSSRIEDLSNHKFNTTLQISSINIVKFDKERGNFKKPRTYEFNSFATDNKHPSNQTTYTQNAA